LILTFGDTSSFGDMQWYMVELRSERTVESTLRRLGQQLRKIFRDTAVELFVPIQIRDLHNFELSTGNYIFARSPVFTRLLAMRQVTGVVGLVCEGDARHPSRAIPIDHTFVKATIEQAEMTFLERARDIDVGSFVRIVDGEMRDWCGTVTEVRDGVAAVRVEIKTKIMLVETPVRNLLDKSFVPEPLRVFYYGELVEGLETLGLAHLLEDDLHFSPEDTQGEDDGLEATPPTKHGRQQTVTALVNRLIVTGTLDPNVIGREVLQALMEGTLKSPKNLSIVHGIIKSRMIEDHFKALDPTIKNYRDVVERFGPAYKFSLQDLVKLDPGTGIPLTTEEDSEAIEEVTHE
jgi:hypothetical protein